MKVLIFSKPTEFNTIKLSGGGQYVSDNSKHVCSYSYSSNHSDAEIIDFAKAECKRQGFELGSVQEVSTKTNGFYVNADCHERDLYNYKSEDV